MFYKRKNKDKKGGLKKKLLYKYRVVFINEDTLDEKISFRVSWMNLLAFGSFLSISLITITILIIFLTPLREYVPGHTTTEMRREVKDFKNKLDSLDSLSRIYTTYTTSVGKMLRGEVDEEQPNTSTRKETNTRDVQKALEVKNPLRDSIFKTKIEEEMRYNTFNAAQDTGGIHFIAPVKGIITGDYNSEDKHYAIDILCKPKTPIKSIYSGIVIFSEWTIDGGKTIIIKHPENITSIYKHNHSLVKKQGDIVNTGEVIALSGNSGEISTGPHLHFELWLGQYPVNPKSYILF